ncbi:hypothetical protein ACVVIH_20545 [Chryseobacterium arthrosphaerae]
MIAPQELRLGNKVLRNGIVVTVDNQTFWDVEKYSDQYESIELTEHWLLKFGFDKKQIRADLKNKLGDYAYSLNSVPFFTLIQDNDGFMLSKFETYLITVKNVHQFQNLFHSFTGEELKIKE